MKWRHFFNAFMPASMWDTLNWGSITLLGLLLAQLRLSGAKVNGQKRKHRLSSDPNPEPEQITLICFFSSNRSCDWVQYVRLLFCIDVLLERFCNFYPTSAKQAHSAKSGQGCVFTLTASSGGTFCCSHCGFLFFYCKSTIDTFHHNTNNNSEHFWQRS